MSRARAISVRPGPSTPGRFAPLRSGHGFTLLEVMVALAILAAAMLSASQLTSAALRNHQRAVHLEVATLLAKGKLAALEDQYDRSGFKDSDETDEGTFDQDGHPEVRWKVEVLKPKADLGPEQMLAMFTGGAGGEGNTDALAALLGGKAAAGGNGAAGAEAALPGAAAAALGPLQAQLGVIGEQIKKGLREVRLTVAWKDGKRDESFTVVTHIVAFPKPITPSGP